MQNYLIFIVGPTAVGKTALSVDLAELYKSEIISCDSRQIFKELSIGTAVPEKSILDRVKHHFIQTVSIHAYFNAYMYEVQALEIANDLFKSNKMVFMTGGSGLYVDAILNGIDDIPTIDPEVRNKLEERFRNEGLESLRLELKRKDPDYYAAVDLKNPKRILKALEVSVMTGKPYSGFLTKKKKERNFNNILIGLDLDRNELHLRINNRVDQMIQNGLLDEAKRFYEFKHINSLNTVGYKELFMHFDGQISLEEAVELIKRNTRRYARRQISWFKRYKDLIWFRPDNITEIEKYIEKSVDV